MTGTLEESEQPPELAGQDGRLGTETAWVFVFQASGVAIRYAGAIFTSRALGLPWFGSFILGMTVVTLLSVVSACGVSPGVLPFLARARRSGRPDELRAVLRATWLLVAGVGLSVSILVVALAPWLAVEVFDDPRLVGILRVLALFVLANALLTATTTLVQGLVGAREQAFVLRFLVPLVTVVGLALTWAFDAGLRGALAATVIGVIPGLVLAGKIVLRAVPGAARRRAPSDARAPVRRLAQESWPLMGSNILVFLLTLMDVLLMGVLRTSEEVGVYGACSRIAPLVLLVQDSAGPVMLRRLSAFHAAGDWSSIRTLYRATGRWSLWSGATIGASFFVWRHELLALFGPEFVAGASILAILVGARAIATAAGMCGRVLAITGMARLNLVNMLLLVTANGLLGLFWIPRFGGVGAAWATLFSIASVKILQTAEVWMIFRLHPFTGKSVFGLLTPLGIAYAALQWKGEPTDGAGWIFALAAFIGTCIVSYLVLGSDPREREFLRTLVRRRSR